MNRFLTHVTFSEFKSYLEWIQRIVKLTDSAKKIKDGNTEDFAFSTILKYLQIQGIVRTVAQEPAYCGEYTYLYIGYNQFLSAPGSIYRSYPGGDVAFDCCDRFRREFESIYQGMTLQDLLGLLPSVDERQRWKRAISFSIQEFIDERNSCPASLDKVWLSAKPFVQTIDQYFNAKPSQFTSEIFKPTKHDVALINSCSNDVSVRKQMS